MCPVPPQCCFQEKISQISFFRNNQEGSSTIWWANSFSIYTFICFWAVQIFMLSEMRLSVRTHYGSSIGWIFISRNITWGSKSRKLSPEYLQIIETEISPKMDKIAITTKKQVLSVRKLSPAHSQAFWWNYSKVTSANPSVLHFLSELYGREYCVLEKR